ncbi:MAG: peroxiredoxin [Anaerolineae bacterium]|nr:peroxiredoxin [Anaerolineae bacterium]
MGMPVPEVGQPAPDFEVLDDRGEMVRLSDLVGQRVVLYFYPKADTPGCTKQSCAYRDNYSLFATKNAVILGASPDTVEEQAAFKVKYNLPFTLLADHDRVIANTYGVWQTYINSRGDETTGIRRSSFIIDEAGRISGVFIGVDPANNTQEMLANL